MRKSTFLLAVCASCSLLAATLVPGTQIPITMDGSLFSPVAVGGNSSGFMAVWQDGSENIQSSFFSSGGSSWSTRVQIASNSSYMATVAGNDSGFVAVWVNVPPGGFALGNVYSGFSNDNGANWSVNQISAAGGDAWYPIGVAANSVGFMAAWVEFDGMGSDVWVSYSSDGTTWGSPVEVYSGADVAQNTLSGIAATDDGFMVSWVSVTTNSPYSSFSNDNGATWSAPSNISTSLFTDAYGAQLAGTSDGFMAVWQDSTNTLQSSFSTDHGTMWSSPVAISSSVYNADTFVSASSAGFIAGWHDGDSNPHGAISTDNGVTWNSVAIAEGGNLNNSTYDSFVSVYATSTGAMFTWIDDSSNGQSNFATLSSSAPNPPTGLSGSQSKNNFATLYELYNTLEWTASSSGDVASYYVFRNGTQIATLGPTATSYQDHNQKRGSSATYIVTAVDGSGNQSAAATVTVN